MTAYDDEDGDDDWENDGGDSDDDSDDEPTVPCPHCHREILEDSPHCPYCDRYLSSEDDPWPRRPIWVTATALACLGIAIWWIFR